MLGTPLVFLALLMTGPPADDLAAYKKAAGQAGRDAEAHVRLALWSESRGMPTERARHLALAILLDPANATARGLLGLVADGGHWRRPEAVAERVHADPKLSAALDEYVVRRDQTPETAEAQWKLALWCEEKGLKSAAMAHFRVVTRLQPEHPRSRAGASPRLGVLGPLSAISPNAAGPPRPVDHREAAWKRLGYRKVHGRWMTDSEIAEQKAEAEAQRQANHHWLPQIETWKADLGDKPKRAEAEAALADLTDPRAVPSVWRVFGQGGAGDQARAVQLLGQIDSPSASQVLAALAVSSPSAEIRRRATETLVRRDPRDFVDRMIGLLRNPIKYEVRPVGGPGSPGELFIEGERANVRRRYSPPALPAAAGLQPDDILTTDVNGLPVIKRVDGFWGDTSPFPPTVLIPRYRSIPIGRMMIEGQESALLAQQQLLNDAASIDQANTAIRESNEMVLAVLRPVTGQDFADDRESWWAWWTDQKGYVYTPPKPIPKPTLTQNMPLAFVPAYAIPPVHHSCFGAGTPVRTLAGTRPIESLKVGDQVLTQDARTGALSYQPIVAIFHNPPSPTLKIRLSGDETIVVTAIHRFWKAGQGWVMARELKPGDTLRTLGGTAEVASIESDANPEPVFNLEVARGQSFFVGRGEALVHDNSLVEPTPRPFDAVTKLARAGGLPR